MCTGTLEPIAESEKLHIVSDRLLALDCVDFGYSIVIIAIVKQSQKSVLLLHADGCSIGHQRATSRRATPP